MILHLMTQRGQPYGSERRCCERCGLMLVARDAAFWKEHAWVDEENLFVNTLVGGKSYTRCDVKEPT